MFLPCLAGMATGLAIDCASVHPEALANLCSSSDDPWVRAWVHWKLMPAAHVLMLVGAVFGCAVAEATRARDAIAMSAMRFGAHGACLLAMSAGMAIGAQFGAQASAAFGISGFSGMIAMMVAGMAAGMAATAPLYRLLQRVRVVDTARIAN